MATPHPIRLAAAVLIAAGGLTSAAVARDRPVVFVSIPPQKFVVEQLVGDLVRVEIMLPPGASPATFEPTPRQMAALRGAALYIQIGVPFEGPMLETIATLEPDIEVVDCRRGIALEPMGDDDGHHHGPLDPHIWLDPILMQRVSRNVAASLRERIQESAGVIDTSLPTLLDALDSTDRRIRATLQPFAGRKVLVFHPAYGYFTRRYGLVQIAVESDGKAPTARRLAEIVDSLRGNRIPAIFVQPQFSQTAAQRIADSLGCRLIVLDPLAENYLENLRVMADRIAATMVN